MVSDENKTLVCRLLEEGFNQNNWPLIDEFIAPAFVNYSYPATGPEGFKQLIGMFRSAFPDMRVAVEKAIAEGDTVATRGYFTGTHQGDFMGIPPTGKTIKVGYSDMWRVDQRQLVENWVQMDQLALLQQLGAIPAAAPAGH